MTDKTDLRAISTLMGDALSQFSTLIQNEIDLAKAEIGEKAQHVGVASGFLFGAAVLVIPAIMMALFALSAALVEGGWSEPVAYLISALAAVVLAAIFALVGMQRLKPEKLKPSETLGQLERDKATVQGFVR
ncbi:phage holin family protein [Bradyrhizobium sp. LHD-71]|uniref:phage holin family protein n=1 Tax=Bradyrhizobium sp. LHD-71 TaxID=3072141 RepID=UPI00280DDDA6|nr:phage holin family protein [Bradyrhizobium sp. LHD-71]MDQ8729377.1 phage holin family protein [Bradyrhizobium sp. LHD-71]